MKITDKTRSYHGKCFYSLHEELILLNNDEINDVFGRFVVVVVVETLFVLLGRLLFVCRRCLAKRSLLVKNNV